MRALVTIAAKWLVLAVAAMMVMLSLDVFDIEIGFWDQVLAFFIHAWPGFALGAMALLLWKKPLWFGAMNVVLALGMTVVFFRMGEEINWGLLTLTGPLVLAGAWLIFIGWPKRSAS